MRPSREEEDPTLALALALAALRCPLARRKTRLIRVDLAAALSHARGTPRACAPRRCSAAEADSALPAPACPPPTCQGRLHADVRRARAVPARQPADADLPEPARTTGSCASAPAAALHRRPPRAPRGRMPRSEDSLPRATTWGPHGTTSAGGGGAPLGLSHRRESERAGRTAGHVRRTPARRAQPQTTSASPPGRVLAVEVERSRADLLRLEASNLAAGAEPTWPG